MDHLGYWLKCNGKQTFYSIIFINDFWKCIFHPKCESEMLTLLNMRFWFSFTSIVFSSAFCLLSPFLHSGFTNTIWANQCIISLLILFLLNSWYGLFYHYPLHTHTYTLIALWAKLWFISTSWQRYAELIIGCKWTSQQSEKVKGGKERVLNIEIGSDCQIIFSAWHQNWS